jgi:acetyl esterase/lipase
MYCLQYTLYPEGLVPQLVEEVSAAFDWAMDHVGQYGGDTQQVSLCKLVQVLRLCT